MHYCWLKSITKLSTNKHCYPNEQQYTRLLYTLNFLYIFFFLATLVCVCASLHLINLKIDGRIQPPILLNICRTRTFDLIDQLIRKCKCKRTHSKERAHCDVWEVRVGSIPSTLRHAFLPEFVQFIL